MHRALSLRRYTRRILLPALLLTFPLAATAVEQSTLPGWGPYTFGMAPLHAISAASSPVSPATTQTARVLLPGTERRDLSGRPDDLLDSAKINGQLYTVV